LFFLKIFKIHDLHVFLPSISNSIYKLQHYILLWLFTIANEDFIKMKYNEERNTSDWKDTVTTTVEGNELRSKGDTDCWNYATNTVLFLINFYDNMLWWNYWSQSFQLNLLNVLILSIILRNIVKKILRTKH